DHLLKNSDGTNTRGRLQQRNHFVVEDAGQRIRPAPLAVRLLARGQSGILLDAVGCSRADRRLCCGDRRRVGLSELHVEPHLVIGYVAAGHKQVPPNRTNPIHNRSTAITRNQPEGWSSYPLILIDAELASRLPRYTDAIDREVLGKDPHDLRLEGFVALGTCRQPRGIPALGNTLMIGGWGDWQDAADRLDPIMP